MSNYEITLRNICGYIGDQHPEITAAMAHKHKLFLSNKIVSHHNNTVVHGPLKGLTFAQQSHWGLADRGGMILGLYEQEILRELLHIPSHYDVFIDLGAADGYYGIGVLVARLFNKSYCFEITEDGRSVIAQTAIINNVSDKVEIRGVATKDTVLAIPQSELDRSVLFVDIEGGEFDLFDEIFFYKFSNSIVFVELHDWVFPDGIAKLNKFIVDSERTHTCKFLKMGERDLSSYPELELWNDLDRWMLCSEGRARLMTWVRLDPLHHETRSD